jgi:hypothetical protein
MNYFVGFFYWNEFNLLTTRKRMETVEQYL